MGIAFLYYRPTLLALVSGGAGQSELYSDGADLHEPVHREQSHRLAGRFLWRRWDRPGFG